MERVREPNLRYARMQQRYRDLAREMGVRLSNVQLVDNYPLEEVREGMLKMREVERIVKYIDHMDKYPGSLAEYERVKGQRYKILRSSGMDIPHEGSDFEYFDSWTGLCKIKWRQEPFPNYNQLKRLVKEGMVAIVNAKKVEKAGINNTGWMFFGTPVKRIKSKSH